MKRHFLPKKLSVGKVTDHSLFFGMSEFRSTAKTESWELQIVQASTESKYFQRIQQVMLPTIPVALNKLTDSLKKIQLPLRQPTVLYYISNKWYIQKIICSSEHSAFLYSWNQPQVSTLVKKMNTELKWRTLLLKMLMSITSTKFLSTCSDVAQRAHLVLACTTTRRKSRQVAVLLHNLKDYFEITQ